MSASHLHKARSQRQQGQKQKALSKKSRTLPSCLKAITGREDLTRGQEEAQDCDCAHGVE